MTLQKPLLFIITLTLLAGPALTLGAARDTPIERHYVLEAPEKDIGFCQAVRAGDKLYLSGMVGRGGMKEAMDQAYGSLRRVLALHDLTFADVVKETVFTTDLTAFLENREARKYYYGSTFPAASWVEVKRLAFPELTLQVELVAHLGK